MVPLPPDALASRPPDPSLLLDAPRPFADRPVIGAVVVLRVYNVGWAITLGEAAARLGAGQSRPSGTEAEAIVIANAPVTVDLAAPEGAPWPGAMLRARLYEFGVISMRLLVPAARPESWSAYAARVEAADAYVRQEGGLDAALAQLVARLGAAVVRPTDPASENGAAVEDYVICRLWPQGLLATGTTEETPVSGPVAAPSGGAPSGGAPSGGAPSGVPAVDEDAVAMLLLGERRRVSSAARAELMPHRFTYYPDDLAILTWERALVIAPEEGETDVEYILEFANAQLLELRGYDRRLGTEVARMYDRLEAQHSRPWPRARWGGMLADVQRTVAEVTETVERVENALKVTDDVFLARVYSAALDLFRGRQWRASIDRQLGVMRDTYAMLNETAQARRSESLEVIVVLLILIEVVLGLVRHGS